MKLVVVIILIFSASFLQAEEKSFKFMLGGNIGNFPLEINKINKNKKQLMGLKVNNWILSPNVLSFAGNKFLTSFPEKKSSKDRDKVYFKLNFKF